MSNRIHHFVAFFIVLILIFTIPSSGFAQGDQPPRQVVTTLYRVADIYAGATGSAPEDLVVYSGELYFGANGNDGAGRELWKYNPSTGSARVADIYLGINSSYPYYLTVYNGALFFGANGNDGFGRELWRYTPSGGAERIDDVCAGAIGSDPQHLEVLNDILYFAADGCDGAGKELWSYDTTHGAQRVADIYGGGTDSNPNYLTAYNDALYFTADGGDGAGRELWMYDSTNGVQRVDDIKSTSSSNPLYLTVYNDALYFGASGDEGAGQELWMYDPVNGAQMVADINTGAGNSNPTHLVVYNGALYFTAYGNDGTGSELWKYDLVNGADRVADIYPGITGSMPMYPTVYYGSLYFQANGGDGAGPELWAYGNSSSAIFRSVSGLDGWVLESGETTEVGGTINASGAVFNLGDNAQDRQYRAILSFNTSTLPDNAVVTGLILAIRSQGITGTDPFTTHGNIRIDIRSGGFSNNTALQAADFQGAASKANVGTIQNLPDAENWFVTKLQTTAYAYINLTGATQIRLRFQVGDNDDLAADFIKFFSGNYGTLSSRPFLAISYYVP